MAPQLLALLPGQSEELSAHAEALPYASLTAGMNGNEALMVMAYQVGTDTMWQAQDRATLQLRQGFPYSTAGFDAELLSLTYPSTEQWAASDSGHPVSSHWRDSDGNEHYLSGQVSRRCEAAQAEELPLATLELQRCEERVEWSNGDSSRNITWRDPNDQRLWAGDIEAWPGAARLEWQVARPWW
ncbi:YjbF family lipoprotein [Litchfieldella anticariensis]|nr:YjbF family lipoprotein [Halomonas anticariensis]